MKKIIKKVVKDKRNNRKEAIKEEKRVWDRFLKANPDAKADRRD